MGLMAFRQVDACCEHKGIPYTIVIRRRDGIYVILKNENNDTETIIPLKISITAISMSQLFLDFSLQGEEGRKPTMNLGLSKHDRTLIMKPINGLQRV